MDDASDQEDYEQAAELFETITAVNERLQKVGQRTHVLVPPAVPLTHLSRAHRRWSFSAAPPISYQPWIVSVAV